MLKTITLQPAAQAGPVLAGRAKGSCLRQTVIDAAATATVEVDLQGVLTMSPSFADEVFGKCGDLMRHDRLRVTNAAEPLLDLIAFVRAGRSDAER